MLLLQILSLIFLTMAQPLFADTSTTTSTTSTPVDIYGRETGSTFIEDPNETNPNCWTLDPSVLASITNANSFGTALNTLISGPIAQITSGPLTALGSDSSLSQASDAAQFNLTANNNTFFNYILNAIGQIQALVSVLIQNPSYSTADQQPFSNFTLDNSGNYVSGDQPTNPSSLAYQVYMLYYYLYECSGNDTATSAAITPIYNSYSDLLKSQITSASQLLLYMLAGKTTTQVASFDQASNATESQAYINTVFPVNTQSTAQYTSNPLFMIHIAAREVNSSGNVATSDYSNLHGYLTLSSDGALYCDETAQYNTNSFFKVTPHPSGGHVIALQVPSFSTNYLADTDPVKLGITATAQLIKGVEKKMSRITDSVAELSATDFTTAFELFDVTCSDTSKKFVAVESLASTSLVNNMQTDSSGNPVAAPQGFWFIETDNSDGTGHMYIRSYLSSGAGYPAATLDGTGGNLVCVCTAQFVDAFATQLAATLAAPNITAKLTQFGTLFNSGLNKSQLLAAILALETTFKNASTVEADWQTLTSLLQSVIIPMLLSIRNTYFSAWAVPTSLATDSVSVNTSQNLIRLLGVNTVQYDITANQTPELQAGQLLTNYVYNISVSNFTTLSSGSFVNFTQEVNSLVNRFTTLDGIGLSQFLTDIEALVCVGTTPLANSSIIEAFPTDLSQLTNTNQTGILDILPSKIYFQNADTSSTSAGSYTKRLKNILSTISQTIPVEIYMANLQLFVVNNLTFTSNQITLFNNKLNRILASRSTATDPIALEQSVLAVINTVLANQLSNTTDPTISAAAAALVAQRKILTGYLASAGITTETYSNRISDVENLVANPNFNSSQISTLLAQLQSLVNDRVDATLADVNTLTSFFTGPINQNQIIFFDSNGATLKTIQGMATTFSQPVAFSDRLANITSFIQNNATSRYISSAGTLNPSPPAPDVIATFAIPLLDKLQFMVNARASAAAADLTAVPPLITFVEQNQLKLSLTTTFPYGTYQGLSVQAALDNAYSGLSGALSYETMTYSGKVNYVATMLENCTSSTFVAQDFCQKLSDLVTNKIEASPSDIQSLSTVITGAGYKDALKGVKPGNANTDFATFLTGLQASLNTPLTISDYQTCLNNYATSAADLTIIQQNDFISKANALMSLQSSINSSNYQALLNIINEGKFNKIAVALRPSLDPVIAMLQQCSTINATSITDQITSLQTQISALTPAQTTAAANIVQTSIPAILLQKLDASPSDITAMGTLLDTARWNAVIGGTTPPLNYTVTALGSGSLTMTGTIGGLVDLLFKPYLAAPAVYGDLYNSLSNLYNTLSAETTISQGDQAKFLNKATTLVSLLGQATLAQLNATYTLLNTAMFNSLSAVASNLKALVAKVSNMITAKTPASTVALTDYNTLLTNFNTAFSTMSATNIASTVSTYFQPLVDNKVYAQATDLAAVIAFVQSDAFVTNNIIAMQGGKAQFAPAINSLLAPIAFMDHYTALQNLVRMVSATPPTTLSAYYIAVALEKLGILATSGAAIYDNKIAYDDVRVLIVELTQSTQFPAASLVVPNVFSSQTDLLAKIKAGMDNEEQFSVPFATRVQTIVTNGPKITTAQNASDFYDFLNALLLDRAEAATADITTLETAIKQAVYATNFIALLNTAKGITNAQDLITNMTNTFSTPIANSDRATWLLNILQAPTLATQHPALIVKILGDFLTAIPNDASGSQKLSLIQSACQRAMATTLAQSTNLAAVTTLYNNLTTMIQQQVTVQESLALQQLQTMLSSLGTDFASLKGFIVTATNAVNQRLNLSDSDLALLVKTLTALQFKPAYTSYLNSVYDSSSGNTVKQTLTNLISDAQQEPTFEDRLDDIEDFYTQMDTSSTSQTTFMNKMNKTIALKTDNLVRMIDDDGDLIYTLISLLNTAASDKMSTMQSQILSTVNNLTTYRQGIQANLPVPYSILIDQLKQSITTLTSSSDAANFIAACKVLVKNRVQGTTAVLTSLNAWLTSTTVTNNPQIYSAQLKQSVSACATALIQPIDVTSRYNELQRMISQFSFFSIAQKSEFYSKLSDLVNQKSDYAAAKLDQQSILDVISYAQTSIYEATDTFTNSSGQIEKYSDDLTTMQNTLTKFTPNVGKCFSDLLTTAIGMTAIPDIPATATSSAVIGSAAIDGLFQNIGNDQTKAKTFVTTLQSLVAGLVDALPADISRLSTFLNSGQIQTTEAIYYAMGNSFSFVNTLIANMSTPISYSDRVTNLTNFVTSAQKPFTDQQKQIFLGKTQLLFNYRGDAAAAGVNLGDLQSLLTLVISSRFDQTADQATYIVPLTNMANKITLPVQPSGVQNFDFSIDIQALINSFALVKDTTSLNAFIAKIADVATRRVNSIFVNSTDTQDQIQTLYNGLFVDPTVTSELNINTNDFVYFNAANMKTVKTAAQALIQPVAFADMFTNLKNFVAQYSTFDTSTAALFLKLVDKMVRSKNLASKENFNPQDFVDLLDKVSSSRTLDATVKNSITSEISTFQTQDNSNAYRATYFTTCLATFMTNYFNNQNINSLTSGPSITSSNVAQFVTDVEALVSNRADATADEFTSFKNLIDNILVKSNLTLKLNTTLKSRFDTASGLLDTPVTFSDLADNLISMISQLTVFVPADGSSGDSQRFLAKLQRVVDHRADGYSSGYDMNNLISYVQVVLATQMPNNQSVNNLYTALQIAPKTTAPDPFVNYADRLAVYQKAFTNLSINPSYKTTVANWVNSLQSMVTDRVQGLIFDPVKKTEDSTNLANFADFIDNDVRYQDLVLNLPPETVINNYLSIIEESIKFTDLVATLTNLANTSTLFSEDRKTVFVNQLDRIVARRAAATADQVNIIVRTINSVKNNRFQSAADGAFLDTYVTNIKQATTPDDQTFATNEEAAPALSSTSTTVASSVAPDVSPPYDATTTQLGTDVTTFEAVIASVLSQTASITDSQRAVWVQSVDSIYQRLQARLTGTTYNKLGQPYAGYAQRTHDAATSLNNAAFLNKNADSQVQADLNSDITNLVNIIPVATS